MTGAQQTVIYNRAGLSQSTNLSTTSTHTVTATSGSILGTTSKRMNTNDSNDYPTLFTVLYCPEKLLGWKLREYCLILLLINYMLERQW